MCCSSLYIFQQYTLVFLSLIPRQICSSVNILAYVIRWANTRKGCANRLLTLQKINIVSQSWIRAMSVFLLPDSRRWLHTVDRWVNTLYWENIPSRNNRSSFEDDRISGQIKCRQRQSTSGSGTLWKSVKHAPLFHETKPNTLHFISSFANNKT